MLIPTTYASTLAMFVLALICFSIWPNLYKQSQSGWRFELFSLDFALGSLFFALLTAYTIGTLGPEISFTDRMLVAGRASALWLIGAGMIFALANMLLLPAISLLGMAVSFSVTFAAAGVMLSLIRLRAPYFAAASFALALFLTCLFCGAFAAQAGQTQARIGRRVKGLILAVFSGILYGALPILLRFTADPEFGPGPYATILMLAIGTAVATPALDFFFMHIKIIGNPISYRTYVAGVKELHFSGLVSGCLWSAGLLCLMLAVSAPADAAADSSLGYLLPTASIVICLLLGLFRWKEHSYTGSRARLLLLTGAACLAGGLIVLARGFDV